jgi:hypothetical protein
MATPKLFLGMRAAPRVLTANDGYADNAVTYQGFARSSRVAPAGIDGEIALFALHVAVQWEGACAITVTPIVDDRRLDPQTYALTGVVGVRKSTILEVPTRLRFPATIDPTNTLGTFAARGTWVQAEVTIDVDTDAELRGPVLIEGVSMELEIVREGKTTGLNP